MKKPKPDELQQIKADFLAERSRRRAAMIEQAGFAAPVPPPPAGLDEDRRAEQILARLNSGLPTTAEERLYLRRKLFAASGGEEYVPAPIRALPSQEKLLLEARLMAIDHAERREAKNRNESAERTTIEWNGEGGPEP